MLVSAAAAQPCEALKPVDRLIFPDLPLNPVERPTHHLTIPQGPLSSVRVSLNRNPCYGSCPDYAVELNGDGSASFTGRRFVLVEGKHTFKVKEESIQCLLFHFRQADFWSLKDEYAADVTDGPQYRLTLTIGGQSKSVVDYFGLAAGMPSLITAIEDEVDHAAGVDRWVKGTVDTLPGLREGHFDFRSESAAALLAGAAAAGPVELVSGLIDAGTPVTGRAVLPGGREGPTAIEQACRGGRIAIVQAMIARGALSDGSQDTLDGALRAAAASGDPQVVAEILKHRPHVNAQDVVGDTALFSIHRSSMSGTSASNVDLVGVARLLIAAGADANVTNRTGQTALFGSSSAGVVRLLLKSGAKIDVRDRDGNTPLLSAGSDEAAVVLIEAGAETAAVNSSGETVDKVLESRNYSRAVQLLHARKR